MSENTAAIIDHSWDLECGICGEALASHQGHLYRCPTCGGTYELSSELEYAPDTTDNSPGIGKYRSSFPLHAADEFFSLGEGNTPLIPHPLRGDEVYLKNEGVNPTGSFKDRGTAVLMSAIAKLDPEQIVEDSSGNAGASFAAYAARAGLPATVFIPADASGPKRRQIEAYGAKLVPIEGPRSAASAAVLDAYERGAFYASHAYWPHGSTGMATVAFELVDQLGEAPGAVVVPAGQGSLLLGCYYGFEAMINAGEIKHMPKLIGVQAKVCAPLWRMAEEGLDAAVDISEDDTLAEGIRITSPHRAEKILQAVEASGGGFFAVEEHEIRLGHRQLARQGIFAEPTSCVVWPVLQEIVGTIQGPIVAILTGSGYKSPLLFDPETN